jgi:hypothetical protein
MFGYQSYQILNNYMSLSSIIPSNAWIFSIYSSSISNFTTGVSIKSTSTETTFTIGASATTIVISSNRNTASRRLSGRAVRFAAVGAQRFPSADAEALTPTSAQAPSGLVDRLPVADHPKPPPWKDKVELTIDSLQNYALLKPIQVIVESLGDRIERLYERDQRWRCFDFTKRSYLYNLRRLHQ